MRLGVSDSFDVGELVAHVRSQAVAAQEHQGIPFEQVVEIVRPPRSLAHNPVFQVMFAWQNAPKGMIDLAGLQVSPFTALPHNISKFDLTLSLQQEGNQIVGEVEYATALFERSTIERYLGYFRTLLGAMVADDSQKVDRLPMLPQEERQQLLYEWNDDGSGVSRETSACTSCSRSRWRETPDAVAVVFEGEELNYGELNGRANRLAHYLRELGVKPDERVAICLERSFEMIVGLLAVLKAGGAYVPLDPGYPKERLRYMLEDSAPVLVLTRKKLMAKVLAEIGAKMPMVEVDEVSIWEREPDGNPPRAETGLTSSHLAYLIYTSGSTGQPKGVAVEHRNTVNFICWAQSAFSAEVMRHTLFATSLNFDLAIYECFVPLSRGASIRIVRDVLDQGHAAIDLTLINTVPSAMNALLNANQIPPLCGSINLAGEPLKKALVERIFDNTQAQAVCNLYGPTETTTYSTSVVMNRGENFAAHIGRPIANTQVYILDRYKEPVPVGVSGRTVHRRSWGSAGIFEPSGADGGEVSPGSIHR